MSEYVVDNLPAPIFEKCRKIDLLHDMFVKGIDPFFVETDKIKMSIGEHDEFENNRFEERKNAPAPSISINVEELWNLTKIVQNDIWRVTKYHPTGKVRVDIINEQINKKFMEFGIDNYASQLEVFIKSLIVDDGWNPESFRGYQHLLAMIRDTKGLTKMNYLQALMNKARKMMPPNISTTPVYVIEPSISKSANPKDA